MTSAFPVVEQTSTYAFSDSQLRAHRAFELQVHEREQLLWALAPRHARTERAEELRMIRNCPSPG